MQSINHDFTRPASPQVPYLSPIPNKNILVQTSFDGSIPANKIIHVTNYNNNNVPTSNVQTDSSILEESCDSYLDSENEDTSMPGKPQCEDVTNTQLSFISALNKVGCSNHNGVKTESVDPYHIPARFQSPTMSDDISPQKELKNLIKEVEISNINTQDYSPLDSPIIDKLTEEVPRIEIVEEPETTYRARYESEGCKGPIHGSSETGFPSVKIIGYVGEVLITVYVVTRDNEPHLHTATGPGSTKSSCKEVVLEDGTPAVQMVLKPVDENDEMIAVFDQLSVRRVRNWEADRELRKRGIEPASWKSKKKEAKLAFQAAIKPTNYHPGYVLTTYSRTFLCTAPSGNPEIWWASLAEGSPEGGEELGLIGKKFASGFKIRFFSKEDDGEFWEVFADVDRAKSNLNACVVKVPPYKETTLNENVIVYVEIRVGPEKEPRCSDPYPFTYVAAKTNAKCDNCVQIKGLLQRLFAEKSGDGSNGLSLRVQNHTAVSLNGGLVQIDPTKVLSSTIFNDRKEISQTQATNYNSTANVQQTGNLSSGVVPLLQPYVVKTGDIVSLVDNAGSRADTTNNVGVLYVQKVPENNNIPLMFQGSKPLTINNNLNLNPQKLMLSTQPTQNINMTLPKIIVPQTLNNLSVSLTNHIPLPSIVQVCSVNTSVFPTLTRTAAGVTSIQQHAQHQLIHVVSDSRAISQDSIKSVTQTHVVPTQFLVNGVPIPTQQQFVNSIQQPTCKTMVSSLSNPSNLLSITESGKVRFVNSNNTAPAMNSVVYVKTDNAPIFNEIKEEESPSCYLTFQQGSVSSANTFSVTSQQSVITTHNISSNNSTNSNNNSNNNNNFELNNKSQTTMVFASPSTTSSACQSFHNQSQALVCQTITPATQSPNTVTHSVTSGIMQQSSSQTVQLAPNSGILPPRNEKEMQIINKHIQNLQNELDEKQAASSIQYKLFQGQKVSPYASHASFVSPNVSQPLYVPSNVNNQIVTCMNQPTVQHFEKPVQHFDTNMSQLNHELSQQSTEMDQSHIHDSNYRQNKEMTQFETTDGQNIQRPYQLMHQNITNNQIIGQHQNPSVVQGQSEQTVNRSSNSINSNNTSFSNRSQVQNLFVVSPLSLETRSVGDSLHVNQLQQIPSQQPLSLTVFNQPPPSNDFTQQQVHKDQTIIQSPTQLSSNTFQQDSQHLHHQQQQLFTNASSHISISNPRSIDDITTGESRWDRPSINDAIASNKVGFMDSTSHVKDSQPSSPMVLNIHDNEESDFMETLQQLNNDPQQYSSMPPTPVVTFDSSINSFDSNPQQVSQIDNDLVDQDEFGTSAVSVDYSDAFKNARACERGNANWGFQKTDIDQNQYVQDVSMFSTSSSAQSLSLSNQPGW